VDLLLDVPLGVAFRIVRGLELSMTLRGGRTNRAREHVIGGRKVWARDAWQVAAYVGIAYQWGLRR
jgi:hypothetical protein